MSSLRRGSNEEFSPLAWELAQHASFYFDSARAGDRKIRATVTVHNGPVRAWGATHNDALQNLAKGLDMWQDSQREAHDDEDALCPVCGEPGCM